VLVYCRILVIEVFFLYRLWFCWLQCFVLSND